MSTLRIEVTVCGDRRTEVLERAEFDARWRPDGRLYIRWRDCDYPVRSVRCGPDGVPDNWLTREHGLVDGDDYYIYYDD